jgi:hypothetical protein
MSCIVYKHLQLTLEAVYYKLLITGVFIGRLIRVIIRPVSTKICLLHSRII